MNDSLRFYRWISELCDGKWGTGNECCRRAGSSRNETALSPAQRGLGLLVLLDDTDVTQHLPIRLDFPQAMQRPLRESAVNFPLTDLTDLTSFTDSSAEFEHCVAAADLRRNH
ncbi:hypothetical protein AB0D04_36835 [Streptomyces sp. NPDC048483]|uniref:hypothetical protein n=1 Tax=Streptomyces sp. NPDC048483 TaxID=3154927 RepID=UPI003429FAED